MMLPTDAATTTRRSSLSGTLAARIGLLYVRGFELLVGAPIIPKVPVAQAICCDHGPLALLLLVLRLELRHDRWVRQGRGIAERPALGDVAKEAAHDLSAPRLRQLGREHDVVDATEEPEVAILVALGAVAREIDVVVLRPVLLHEPVGIAPDTTEHSGPRLPEHEIARLRGVALFVEHLGVDARKRERRRARLEDREGRQRRDENVA